MVGLELFEDPVVPEGKILVGDFTSTLLSREVEIRRRKRRRVIVVVVVVAIVMKTIIRII
jgi:hypothetical protein